MYHFKKNITILLLIFPTLVFANEIEKFEFSPSNGIKIDKINVFGMYSLFLIDKNNEKTIDLILQNQTYYISQPTDGFYLRLCKSTSLNQPIPINHYLYLNDINITRHLSFSSESLTPRKNGVCTNIKDWTPIKKQEEEEEILPVIKISISSETDKIENETSLSNKNVTILGSTNKHLNSKPNSFTVSTNNSTNYDTKSIKIYFQSINELEKKNIIIKK